jgi:hypothetical protein
LGIRKAYYTTGRDHGENSEKFINFQTSVDPEREDLNATVEHTLDWRYTADIETIH